MEDIKLLEDEPVEQNARSKSSLLFTVFFETDQIFTGRRKPQHLKKLCPEAVGNILDTIEVENIKTDPKYRLEKKYETLFNLALKLYKENEATGDINDLVFFVAVRLETEKLKQFLRRSVDATQTRDENTILNFIVKFADYRHENFLHCLKIALESKVNVNRCDLSGKTAIDYIAKYYQSEVNEENKILLKEAARLLLAKAGLYSDNTKTVLKEMHLEENPAEVDPETRFFYLLVNKRFDVLEKLRDVHSLVEGYNDKTLLQIFSASSDRFVDVVKFLLRKNASADLTTKYNKSTPLKLAYVHNNARIFEELLNHRTTTVDQNVFKTILRLPKKRGMLREFLTSPKIDPSFKSDSRNTPLHYAIMFGFDEIVDSLLDRGASLLWKNWRDESCLELIEAKHLKNFLDRSITHDYYTDSSADYKVVFNFKSLTEGRRDHELDVIHKIGRNPKLRELLSHPLLHTFVDLKWQQSFKYFWLLFLMQIVIYTSLFFTFYFCNLTSGMYFLSIILVFLNLVFKLLISIQALDLKRNFLETLLSLRPTVTHNSIEFLIAILTLLTILWKSECNTQFLPFIFILMATSVLLTAGYHPKLTKWSFMLQNIFQKFIVFLLIFSVFLIVVTGSFMTISDSIDRSFLFSLYENYVMIVNGRLQLPEFEELGLKGYFLSIVLGIITLTVTSFWLGVAISTIEKIERESKVNSFRRSVVFMKFVDTFYIKSKVVLRFFKFLPRPLLLESSDCQLMCFVNREEQFERVGFPKQLGERCLNKVKDHFFRRDNEGGFRQLRRDLREIRDRYNRTSAGLRKGFEEVRTRQEGVLRKLLENVEEVKTGMNGIQPAL